MVYCTIVGVVLVEKKIRPTHPPSAGGPFWPLFGPFWAKNDRFSAIFGTAWGNPEFNLTQFYDVSSIIGDSSRGIFFCLA